jgi:hypothetical protein
MKTIKQIAEEIGVTKQAVRNEIAKQKLQSTLQKSANALCVPETTEMLVIKEFLKRKNENLNAKTNEIIGSNYSPELGELRRKIRELEFQLKIQNISQEEKVSLYQQEIKHLETELDRRNEHINNLIFQISEVSKITLQSQLLHAGTMQKQLTDSNSGDQAETDPPMGRLARAWRELTRK